MTAKLPTQSINTRIWDKQLEQSKFCAGTENMVHKYDIILQIHFFM